LKWPQNRNEFETLALDFKHASQQREIHKYMKKDEDLIDFKHASQQREIHKYMKKTRIYTWR